MPRALTAALLALALSSTALATYIPKQPIHINKGSGDVKYTITGNNTLGQVNVNISDKGAFQGFRAQGKNADRDVNIDVSSAGLGAGWLIKGKIGPDEVNITCKEDGPFAKHWIVKGKLGDRMIEDVKVDAEWEFDPAAQAIFVLFDCCDEKK
ncbi:MAG: hypothetical protein AB7G17_11610 [Phycisphaerales bacterium]